MAPSNYRYPPLRHVSSFRLLRLKGRGRLFSNADDPVSVEIFEASLESHPTYEAISYTWGQQRPGEAVLCNGKTLQATAAAIDVLKAVRLIGSDRVVWIDSICIDQSSVADKNSQVPKMGRIYKQAQRALIWLGKATYETNTAFDFLRDVVQLLHMALPKSESHSRIRLQMEVLIILALVKERRAISTLWDTNFIFDILYRPWFRRLWTLQELVVAKNGLLLCGQKSLSCYSFLDGLEALKENEEEDFAKADILVKGFWFNEGILYEKTDAYRRLRGMLRHVHEVHAMPGEQAICTMILKSARRRIATEPRDKVYGLYGILEEMEINQLPQIDYLKPVHEVYTEMTRVTILVDHSLRILNEVSAYPRTSGLPSWVPDWSDTAHSTSIYPGLVCAAKTPSPVFSFERSNKLILSGVVLDTLENVALSDSMNTADFDIEEWLLSDHSTAGRMILIAAVHTLREWIRVGRQLQTYATGERLQDAFCLTITQNGTLGNSAEYQTPALYLESFDLWFDIMNADDPENGSGMDHLMTMVETHEKYALLLDVWNKQLGYNKSLADDGDEVKILAAMSLYGPAGLHGVALMNTYHRTLFTTSKRYMGMGARSAQAGDSVAIFSGMKLPFIIRPHQGSYRLIGPAYIHGIMYGEKWPDDLSRLERITTV